MPAPQLSSPRLGALARRPGAPPPAVDADEVCELCGAPVASEHRHLADVTARRLVCVCRPCSLLFTRAAAADGRLKLIPDRPRRLEGLAIDDAVWARLAIPVEMAFFVRSSASQRVEAFYPSPLGATESALDLAAWSDMEADIPELADMADDVEALLVNRTRGHPGLWIVPVDDCYRLVALIRRGWRGLSGGGAVFDELDEFLSGLDRRAHRRGANGERRQ